MTSPPPADRGAALLGALPFLAFGAASLAAKTWGGVASYLVFDAGVLLGLGIGWARGFPRWSWTYLAWAIIFAGWWMSMPAHGLVPAGLPVARDGLLEAWSWTPVALLALVLLLITRSAAPLRRLAAQLWQDWSLLSLGVYSLFAWVILLFDENHNPYLTPLLLAAGVVSAGGAWLYLRAATPGAGLAGLLAGFAGLWVVAAIDSATWDWHAYYGLAAPPSPFPEARRQALAFTLWAAAAALPALLGIIRRARTAR